MGKLAGNPDPSGALETDIDETDLREVELLWRYCAVDGNALAIYDWLTGWCDATRP